MNYDDFKIARLAPAAGDNYSVYFTDSSTRGVLRFHESIEGYAPTPLVSLSCLANELGVSGIYVKDESYRFGLNAFKALGASYAMGRYIANTLGIPAEDMRFSELAAPDDELTFVTATDGNHGRGVAWTAKMLGQKCVVYLPKGSVQERVDNIRKEGAFAEVLELNYDDAVRLAYDNSLEYGWITVQDTAWDGYFDIPLNIMQGYTTMAHEAARELEHTPPTHVFLQAGVGSMAGAVAAYMRSRFPGNPPRIVVVEPNEADCHYRSAVSGTRSVVGGDMPTIMAGLACGEPNIISLELLRNARAQCISCPDFVSATGMRLLGAPAGTDARIISGESGAVTAGLLYLLMTEDGLKNIRAELELDADSRVLLFSTEGATDVMNYRGITRKGTYPAP